MNKEASEILKRLIDEGKNTSWETIITVEFIRFNKQQKNILLPILWEYIIAHRYDNNDRYDNDRYDNNELTAMGSAIRKYIALMPMNKIDNLTKLLNYENCQILPIELEIEISKMIYRNFEIFPPKTICLSSPLVDQLWQMQQAYLNPRILLRDKYATAALLSIEAIIAMRSSLSEDAWIAAIKCPCRWFGETVNDDMLTLQDRWETANTKAAKWLATLRSKIVF